MLVRQGCAQWLWEWGSESRPLDHLRTCSCCPLSRESSGALGSGAKGCRKAVPVGGLGSGDAGAARGWDAPQGSLQAAERNQLDASTARSQPLPFQAQSRMGTNNNPSLNSKFQSSLGQGGSEREEMLEHLGLMSFLAVGGRRNTIQFCSPQQNKGESPQGKTGKRETTTTNPKNSKLREEREENRRKKRKKKGQTNPSP